jgi:mRNA interferase MazF
MATVAIGRGDVVYVNLEGAVGAEKKKTRPCLVVQNDVGNRMSPMTIIAPITDANQDKQLPVQVAVAAAELGAGGKDSVVECGQIRTIDRNGRIDESRGVVAHLSRETMSKVDAALRVSFGL